MASFLNPTQWSGPQLIIRGNDVYLRPPVSADWSAWAQLRSESRGHLQPWEPTWGPDELSRSAFKNRLRRYAQNLRDGSAYAFFIFHNTTQDLMGGLTISNVRRGVTQTGTVGYWMGERFAGRGYMSDALNAVLPFMFDNLGLHRLEAACIPSNHASRSVLDKVGFQFEGHVRKYLKINGKWEDHLLFGILDEDPRPLGPPAGKK